MKKCDRIAFAVLVGTGVYLMMSNPCFTAKVINALICDEKKSTKDIKNEADKEG